MYKCTECGTEYEVKPEYCDCGNDEFEEIQTKKPEVFVPEIEQQTKTVRRTPKPKKTFYEQYPQIERFVDSLDILSVIFFITCLILAILIWIFAWNFAPQEKTKEEISNELKTEMNKNKNIPSLDSFWDNTPAKNKPQTSLKEDDEVFIPVPKVEKVIKKVERPKTNNKPIIKTIFNKPATTQNKTTKQTKTTTKNTQPKTNTQTKKTQQPKPTTTKPTEAKPKTTQQAPTPTQPKTQQVKKTTVTNDKNLQNYKSALRKTLFSRLQIGSIQGQGECIISFAIDSTGKLINRNFVKQSDNKTLNDAVYRMLMNTPQYYAPPSSYNGATLRMRFYFNNGYYEVNYQ